MSAAGLVTPAIMIGGAGSRLWPLSRADKPKQFLRLGGDRTMFAHTLHRLTAPGFGPAWLMANSETFGHVQTEITDSAGIEGVVIEPAMRGTAAAIGALSSALAQTDPERLVLVAPADHFIRDEVKFRSAVLSAVPAAALGHIVTFGIEPTGPETGFGYIAPRLPLIVDGETLGDHVAPGGFREKPDLATARQFVADGYLWNAGIFLFKAGVMLDELARHAPQTFAAVHTAMGVARERRVGGLRQIMPSETAFVTAPANVPIDTAVMERTDKVVVVPCGDIGWSDVGSLSALWEISPRDADGNAASGDVLLHGCRDVFVHGAGRKIVAAHLDGVLIVDTEDALIVLPAAEAQAIKAIVQSLKAAGAPELRYGREARFDWGDVHLDFNGPHHSALSLTIRAGKRIGHRHVAARSETWLVTQGVISVAAVDRDLIARAGQTFALAADDVVSVHATEPAAVAITRIGDTGLSLAEDFGGHSVQPELVPSLPSREVA